MPGTDTVCSVVAELQKEKNDAIGNAKGSHLARLRHLLSQNVHVFPPPPAFLQSSRLDLELWAGGASKYTAGIFKLPDDALFHGRLCFGTSDVADVYSSTGSREAILVVQHPSFSNLESDLWDRKEIDSRFESGGRWDAGPQRQTPVNQLPEFLRRGGLSYFVERRGPIPWLYVHSELEAGSFTCAFLRRTEPLPAENFRLRCIFQRYPSTSAEMFSMVRISDARQCMQQTVRRIAQLLARYAEDDPAKEIEVPRMLESPSTWPVVRASSPSASSDATAELEPSACALKLKVPLLGEVMKGFNRATVANLGCSAHDTAKQLILQLFNGEGEVVVAQRLIDAQFSEGAHDIMQMLLFIGSFLCYGSALVILEVSNDVGVLAGCPWSARRELLR